jgi:hypothetical protein
VQQEELQQTNEELNERSVLLEEQNLEIQKKSEALELSTRYKSEFWPICRMNCVPVELDFIVEPIAR